MTLVIAIDGPAGVGKSTLARRLAETLRLPYLNTGLMYRAVTLEAIRRHVGVDDPQALATLAERIRFELTDDEVRALSIDGNEPSAALTSSEVERWVSSVSAHPEVRSILRAEQRRLAAAGGVVEGRDIGSVVLPKADVKLFLTAASSERATRRAAEDLDRADDVARALEARDARDARVNPFVPAPDAVAIDTTDADADEVFERALEIVGTRTDAP